MKKLIATLLALCLLLSLAACGGSEDTTVPSGSQPTAGGSGDSSNQAGKPQDDPTDAPTNASGSGDEIQVANPLGLKSLILAAYLENAMFDWGEPTPADVTMAMLEGIYQIQLSANASQNTSTLSFGTYYVKNKAEAASESDYIYSDTYISCTLDYIPDMSGDKLNAFFEDLKVAADLRSIKLSRLDIENVDGLAAYPEITRLELVECTGVSNLDSLAKLTSLTHLSISNMAVSDLSPLANLVNLEELAISFCPVTDISPLANLPKLESLNISSTDVTALPVGGTTSVTTFSCGGISSHLTDITNIGGWLADNATVDFALLEISDLSGIEKAGRLRKLNLAGSQVSNESLQYLKDLSIQELLMDSTSVTDLSGLAGSTGIVKLYLQGSKVSDVAPLASCSALEYLNISGTAVTNISPLAACASLKTIVIGGLDVDTSAFEGTSISLRK